MDVIQIILGSILLLVSIGIIIVVLMQQSRQAGLSGVITGAADTFFGKNKSRSVEAKLAQVTKVFGAAFFIVSLATTILLTFLSTSTPTT